MLFSIDLGIGEQLKDLNNETKIEYVFIAWLTKLEWMEFGVAKMSYYRNLKETSEIYMWNEAIKKWCGLMSWQSFLYEKYLIFALRCRRHLSEASTNLTNIC